MAMFLGQFGRPTRKNKIQKDQNKTSQFLSQFSQNDDDVIYTDSVNMLTNDSEDEDELNYDDNMHEQFEFYEPDEIDYSDNDYEEDITTSNDSDSSEEEIIFHGQNYVPDSDTEYDSDHSENPNTPEDYAERQMILTPPIKGNAYYNWPWL